MKHEVVHGPSFALLKLQLDAGETVTAEAGAMVTQSTSLEMKTRLNAGTGATFLGKFKAFFIALIRKLLGGETMFINDFHAPGAPAELSLAPSMAGQIMHRRLDNSRIMLQSGAYLASGPGLSMRLRWGGLRAILAKEGLVFLEISGTGDLWFNAYGGITPVQVDGSFIVDNGHMVAFDGTLDFEITTPGGGAMGFFASGEGLVTKFNGKGTVYIQSRNLTALAGWLASMMS